MAKEQSNYSKKLRDPRWQKLRLEVMSRDEFECKHCYEKDKTLNVHHYGYNGDPWEVEMKALVTLCEDCHAEETENAKESIKGCIQDLRLNGFGSLAFDNVPKIFKGKDRGWNTYEPAYDVLRMVVDDDELWVFLEGLFWDRLREKSRKEKADRGETVQVSEIPEKCPF